MADRQPKTITVPVELEKDIFEFFRWHIDYWLGETNPVEFYFELKTALDTLDLLHYDTEEWRAEFWKRIVDPNDARAKAEEWFRDYAEDFPDFHKRFCENCRAYDEKLGISGKA